MAGDIIDDVIEFWEKIRDEDEVTVRFKKKDGTMRVMRCTLNFDKIPVDKKPKDINIPRIIKLVRNSQIVHVYDLERQDWRSVPFNRCEWLDTANMTRFYIKGGKRRG